MNIRKCKAFCEGKYEECTLCSHHFAYHSHTNEIQEDVTMTYGSNYNRKETLQSLFESIKEDKQNWKNINDYHETALLKVMELEMRLNNDESIRNFKSDFMKEYFQ